MIVVAVAYADPFPGSDDDPEPWKASYRHHRTRDYTPIPFPTGGYGPHFQQHSGGGPAFRRFLAEELIPYVERTFGASPERALVGHSYGGLFATWVALTTPELFDHYLAVSPSLWYAERWIFGAEAEYAEAHAALPTTLFLAVGDRERNRERDMVADLRAFAERLAGRGYDGLELHAEVLDDETHNSVFPRALSDALRAIWPR